MSLLPSFRTVAERLDPVRPPDRLRGYPDHVVTSHLRFDELGWLGVGSRSGTETLSDLCPTVVNGTHAIGIGNVRGYIDAEDKGLWQMHRHEPGAENEISLRALLERHDPAQDSRTYRVLWYNTWMLRPIRVRVGAETAQIAAKPDIDARRNEIGRAIEEVEYNIVGLCEVFSDDDRAELLSEISNHEVRVGAHAPSLGGGPLEVDGEKGSGLCTVTRSSEIEPPHILRDDRMTFSDQGYVLRDTDAFSNKGVLHTEIDIGFGRLDLFTTHMISGGGVPNAVEVLVRLASGFATLGLSEFGWAADRKPVRDIRASQVKELADFVDRVRNPENLVVVMGDFNIEAEPSAPGSEYHKLLREMYKLGLQDTWLNRGSPWGGTHDNKNTCRHDPGGEFPYRCADYEDGLPPSRTHRIDYVFVELPSQHHTFHVDVSRLRRASFWRGNGQDTPYLSDHLGLEFTIVASPL